jgi:hypothetical protein
MKYWPGRESLIHSRTRTSSPAFCSPLQYLKRIRLDRARMLMAHDGYKAGTAARAVGYESRGSSAGSSSDSSAWRPSRRLSRRGPASSPVDVTRPCPIGAHLQPPVIAGDDSLSQPERPGHRPRHMQVRPTIGERRLRVSEKKTQKVSR